MRPVYINAARRNLVAPRGGALSRCEAWEIGAAALQAAIEDAGASPGEFDGVIMGNALYGGGNPARMASLAAKLPDDVPAMTLDTQCCAGLDAIALAAERISACNADALLAGGLESFSRAPIRMRRPPAASEGAPTAYNRPPFAPDPEHDPDPDAADQALAAERGYDAASLDGYAVESHQKAANAAPRLAEEIATARGQTDRPFRYADPFTRKLTRALCQRAPRSAHSAVEADAAAVLALSAESPRTGPRIRILGATQATGDPRRVAEAAVLATTRLLDGLCLSPADIAVFEVMEAFAAQAMLWRETFDVPPERVNIGGGALARGHPIGASGAVLAVRLFHELKRSRPGALGVAAIPAVGGLGTALAMRVDE